MPAGLLPGHAGHAMAGVMPPLPSRVFPVPSEAPRERQRCPGPLFPAAISFSGLVAICPPCSHSHSCHSSPKPVSHDPQPGASESVGALPVWARAGPQQNSRLDLITSAFSTHHPDVPHRLDRGDQIKYMGTTIESPVISLRN